MIILSYIFHGIIFIFFSESANLVKSWQIANRTLIIANFFLSLPNVRIKCIKLILKKVRSPMKKVNSRHHHSPNEISKSITSYIKLSYMIIFINF